MAHGKRGQAGCSGPAGRVLLVLALVWASAAPAVGGCRFDTLAGLYGLTTLGIGETGETQATLSLFQFLPGSRRSVHEVREIFYVSTLTATFSGSAAGTYTVDRQCRFSLDVVDMTGGRYALEGVTSPAGQTVQVMQTIPDDAIVSTGTLHKVGLKTCSPAYFMGRYAVLSQGRIPASGGGTVPQARVGWLDSDGYSLYQPVELVNTDGTVTQPPPVYAPLDVRRNCLLTMEDGSFAGVLTDRGGRLLYMVRPTGTVRPGVMLLDHR